MMAREMVTFTTRSAQTRSERSSSILQRLGTISGSHPFGISCRALSSVIRLRRSRSRRMARVSTRILAALKRYGDDLEKAERVNSSDECAEPDAGMTRSAVSRVLQCERPRRASGQGDQARRTSQYERPFGNSGRLAIHLPKRRAGTHFFSAGTGLLRFSHR